MLPSVPPGQQLGSGAFGRVLKASVTGLDGPGATTVAVKMIKVHMDLSKLQALTKYDSSLLLRLIHISTVYTIIKNL